jgi:hypothetical protein
MLASVCQEKFDLAMKASTGIKMGMSKENGNSGQLLEKRKEIGSLEQLVGNLTVGVIAFKSLVDANRWENFVENSYQTMSHVSKRLGWISQNNVFFADNYISNVFPERDMDYWCSLEPDVRVGVASLFHLSSIAEGMSAYSGELVCEYLRKSRIDGQMLTDFFDVKCFSEAHSGKDFRETVINVSRVLHPELSHIEDYVERIRYVIQLLGPQYKRPMSDDLISIKDKFGINVHALARLITKEGRGKWTMQGVILEAEKAAGLFVPELVMRNLDSVIEHMSERIRENNGESVPNVTDDALFKEFFGIDPKGIRQKAKRMNWGATPSEMLRRSKEKAWNKKVAIHADYVNCKSVGQCVDLMYRIISQSDGDYVSPSTSDLSEFWSIFGIGLQDLNDLCAKKGWSIRAAGLRDLAEEKAGYVKPYLRDRMGRPAPEGPRITLAKMHVDLSKLEPDLYIIYVLSTEKENNKFKNSLRQIGEMTGLTERMVALRINKIIDSVNTY